MKNKKRLSLFILLLLAFGAFSQNAKVQKATFKVYGNCTQCKERIEGALDVKGIKAADWNIDSKKIEVVYNPSKINMEQIHSLIAKVGHDTELTKAVDSVYQELPDCCLYRENPKTHRD